LQAGAIGEIRLMRAYWNGPGVAPRRVGGGSSELAQQLRNWTQSSWLSGGPLVDQHVHNLDVINWLQSARPVSAQGQGNPSHRADQDPREFACQSFVEFTYADGAKLWSQCRRLPGCWNNVSEHVHGTAGRADLSGGKIYGGDGELVWRSAARRSGPQQQQHEVLAALRRGELVNEAEIGATATLTAILGRQAAATGQTVSWDETFHSQAGLPAVDKLHTLDPLPPIA
jgi:predicted dehydrogenase